MFGGINIYESKELEELLNTPGATVWDDLYSDDLLEVSIGKRKVLELVSIKVQDYAELYFADTQVNTNIREALESHSATRVREVAWAVIMQSITSYQLVAFLEKAYEKGIAKGKKLKAEEIHKALQGY